MILLLGLAAALASPSPREVPAQMKVAIQEALDRRLRDGVSARYLWPKDRGQGAYCGWVNAKNALGAYIGWQPYLVVGGPHDGPKGDHKYHVNMVLLGGTDGIAEKMCAE